jgi:hypothetical protein
LNLRAFGAFGSEDFLVVEAGLAVFFAGGATAALLASISARAFLFGGMASREILGCKDNRK